MKPKYNSAKFRNQSIGTTLVSVLFISFSGTLHAADNFWGGTTSSDWNDATNWSLARVPVADNAFVNTSVPNIATISANISATPVDIFVGNGTGNVATLNHTAGIASTGAGNWMYVGTNGGNGTYNLGIPGGGGTFSGLGEGTGSITAAGRLYIGGYGGTGSTAVMNVNTSGTVTVGTFVELGTNTSSGTLNLDKGTINSGTAGQDSWFEIGNGVGCTGILNMSGGVINKIGNQHLTVGTNGATDGTLNMNGGTINVNNEIWIGDFTGSTGNVNLTNGAITVNSWLAVGRRSGNGTLTMTGGSITKTGSGNVTLGTGTGGSGTITQSGGTITNTTSSTFIGEGWEWNGAGTGVGSGQWTISGGEAILGPIIMGNGGSSSGTFNLNGGTLTTTAISDNTSGATNFNFDGGTLKAGAAQPLLINGLDAVTVKPGGAIIDTNGFNVGIPQTLLDGGGGLTKNGAGILTLSPLNEYTGGNTVLGGQLVLNTGSIGGGNITLANSTALGLVFDAFLTTKTSVNTTFGTGDTVNFSVGDLAGTNNSDPLLDVTGNLSVAGNVIVNLAGTKLQAANLPLISFVAANRSGVGNFVLGTLPPGVVGTIVESANYLGTGKGMIYLNITSVALPEWDGTVNAVWDTTTINWVDQVSIQPTKYADPNPALFSDFAQGPTAIVLNTTVKPTVVTFDNSLLEYSLSGTGKISDPAGGTANLIKLGTAGLTLSNSNDYTGVTTLAGGTTTVTALTNGGVSSPLGAASAAPANLVFGGGTLALTGVTPTTINRGLTITGASGLNLAGDLTLTAQTLRTGGGISKSGPGVLKYTNAGPNGLGDMTINGGGVILDGSGGPQINSAANIDVTTATGSSSLTLLGNTTLTTPNRVMTGLNVADAVGAIVVSGTSKFNMTGGWLSIGQTGNGSLTVKDSGSFSMTGSDFNITDLDNSKGTLTLQDNGIINAAVTFWGKNAGTAATINLNGGTFTSASDLYVASADGSMATVTQTAGIVNSNGGSFQMGRNGKAEWNQSGGIINSMGWTILGRDAMGDGTMNVSGGVFNQSQLDRPLMVGEFGKGTLNVKPGGEVNSLGINGLIIANEPTGTGLVNLDGGLLTVRRVREGNDGNAGVGGASTFNFNGGILKAGANANADFMSGLDLANVGPGGARINTNGQDLTIAQALLGASGDGGLSKSGDGVLTLTGANTYKGSTTVTTGTLSLSTPFLADDAAVTIAPGAILNLSHNLTDQVASLSINGSLVGPGIYNQTTTPGIGVITGDGSLEVGGVASPYDAWINSFAGIPSDQKGRNADPDNDGQSNVTEFALGGIPNSGSKNALIFSFVADGSVDVDTQRELLMTVAVLQGTPTFAGSPLSATMSGVGYVIQGSDTLAGFPLGVTAVATVAPPAPNATPPAGYEYRTFSLNGSNGTTTKGFLRVKLNY